MINGPFHEAEDPREPQPNLREQFEATYNAISGVIEKRPNYFGKPAVEIDKNGVGNLGKTKGAVIMESLQAVRNSIEKGLVLEDQRITLFEDSQTRDSIYPEQSANSAVVEDLYRELAKIAWKKSFKDYFDIQNDARHNRDRGRFVEAGLDEKWGNSGRNEAALVDGTRFLRGMQIRLGDNMFANFILGNFAYPEIPDKLTVVELVVHSKGM